MSNRLAISKTTVRGSVGPNDIVGTEVVRHRPKFRLLAATAMFAFIVAGITAMILATRVVLHKAVTMSKTAEFMPVSSGDDSKPDNLVSMVGALRLHPFLTLISFTVVMMLLAFVLRKVVLNGLRD